MDDFGDFDNDGRGVEDDRGPVKHHITDDDSDDESFEKKFQDEELNSTKKRKKHKTKKIEREEEDEDVETKTKKGKAEALKEVISDEVKECKSFFKDFHFMEVISTMLMLFISFIMINSDIFIDQVLGKVPGLTSGGMTTTTGAIVQGIILILAYAVFKALSTIGVF